MNQRVVQKEITWEFLRMLGLFGTPGNILYRDYQEIVGGGVPTRHYMRDSFEELLCVYGTEYTCRSPLLSLLVGLRNAENAVNT